MTSFDNDFNFRSNDWYILREKLVKDLQNSLELLAASDCTHDRANNLRGQIHYIKALLASESSAAKRLLGTR